MKDAVTVRVTACGGGAGDVGDACPLVHHQYLVAVTEPRQILNHLHDGADRPVGKKGLCILGRGKVAKREEQKWWLIPCQSSHMADGRLTER